MQAPHKYSQSQASPKLHLEKTQPKLALPSLNKAQPSEFKVRASPQVSVNKMKAKKQEATKKIHRDTLTSTDLKKQTQIPIAKRESITTGDSSCKDSAIKGSRRESLFSSSTSENSQNNYA